jgi:hypothetical protein
VEREPLVSSTQAPVSETLTLAAVAARVIPETEKSLAQVRRLAEKALQLGCFFTVRFARAASGNTLCSERSEFMALLIILALIVALFIGLGFVVKWLFILAVIAALVWLIAFFMRGARA